MVRDHLAFSMQGKLVLHPILLSLMLVDGDMFSTLGSKGVFSPIAPALLETQLTQLSHEIHLGCPDIAQLYRVKVRSLFSEHQMLSGDHLLIKFQLGDIQLDFIIFNPYRSDGLPTIEALQVRDEGFNHEDPIWSQMPGYVLETADLF